MLGFHQDSFRGRIDNGSESGASWITQPNVGWTQTVDTNFRVRFLIQETLGTPATDQSFQLQSNRNGQGWNNVNASSLIVRSSDSTQFLDGDNTTQQLGSGTFITPNAGMDDAEGLAGGTALDFSGSDETELEFCAQIRNSDVGNNDIIQLRVVHGDGTALNTYTNTPSLTVSGVSNRSVSVFDSPTLTDFVDVDLALTLAVSVFDSLSLSETTAFHWTVGSVVVFDLLTIVDNATLNLPLAALEVSVFDSLIASESTEANSWIKVIQVGTYTY